MKVIGYTVTTIVLAFLVCVFSGYALSVLWEWFVVPVFSAPTLTIPSAIGLSMIVSYLTFNSVNSEGESTSYGEALAKFLMLGISKPIFALFFGWIVTLFL